MLHMAGQKNRRNTIQQTIVKYAHNLLRTCVLDTTTNLGEERGLSWPSTNGSTANVPTANNNSIGQTNGRRYQNSIFTYGYNSSTRLKRKKHHCCIYARTCEKNLLAIHSRPSRTQVLTADQHIKRVCKWENEKKKKT